MLSELLLKLSFLLPVPTAVDQTVELRTHTVWLEERSAEETPEQVIERFASEERQGPSPKGVNLGFSGKSYWFLTRIQNQTQLDEFILASAFSGLDNIRLWTHQGDAWQAHALQGDHNPIKNRALFTRLANYRLVLPPGADILVLYKIRTDSPVQGALTVSSVAHFLKVQNAENAVVYVCYGFLLTMLCYTLYLYYSMRNPLDLLYALFILTSITANLGVQGHYTQYLHPDSLMKYSDWGFVLITPPLFYMMAEFAIHFLALKRFSINGYRVLRALQGLLVLWVATSFFVPYHVYNKFFQLFAIIQPFTVLVVSIVAWWKGQAAARFFVTAFALYIVSIALFLLGNIGVVATNPFIISSTAIGAALQVTLLALALGDRMRLLKRIAREAEQKRQEEEARHKAEVMAWNESLELRVQEQTRDIRSLLESTKVGLMSVTKELEIHKDYARYLETIFEEKVIAGRSFVELILDKMQVGADERQKIVTAMEYAIDEDECMFEANASVFPREAKILVANTVKTLDLDWSPVVDKEGRVERVLLSVRDMTESLKLRQAAEEGRRNIKLLGELLEIGPLRFEKFDKAADATWREIRTVLDGAAETLSFDGVRQIYVGLHTIKGVARMYKLSDLTDLIHHAEELVAGKDQLDAEGLAALRQHLETIELYHGHYKQAIQPLYKIRSQLDQLEDESSPRELHRILLEMSEMAQNLAKELGKAGCRLQVDVPEGLQLDDGFAKALADSLVHLVRNSVDHGLESPAEREAKGKSGLGTIRCYVQDGHLCLEDDGRGLDLQRIKAKAQSLGRSVKDDEELVNLIFDSGFSTKDSATDISGRGIGMDAVREFVRAAGSDITIIPKREHAGFLSFHFAIRLPTSLELVA